VDIYVQEGENLSNFLLYSLTKNIGLYLYRFAKLKKTEQPVIQVREDRNNE